MLMPSFLSFMVFEVTSRRARRPIPLEKIVQMSEKSGILVRPDCGGWISLCAGGTGWRPHKGDTHVGRQVDVAARRAPLLYGALALLPMGQAPANEKVHTDA
jgi:hypothetical protein